MKQQLHSAHPKAEAERFEECRHYKGYRRSAAQQFWAKVGVGTKLRAVTLSAASVVAVGTAKGDFTVAEMVALVRHIEQDNFIVQLLEATKDAVEGKPALMAGYAGRYYAIHKTRGGWMISLLGWSARTRDQQVAAQVGLPVSA